MVTYTLAQTHTHTRTHARTHARACVHTHTHTHTYESMSTFCDSREITIVLNVCLHICVCMFICTCVVFVYGGVRVSVCNIIIIIAFKGAIRDFLQSPHSAANCLQHARSSGPGAIVCKSLATHRALSRATCRVTCHLVRRDSSAMKFDRVEIAFI